MRPLAQLEPIENPGRKQAEKGEDRDEQGDVAPIEPVPVHHRPERKQRLRYLIQSDRLVAGLKRQPAFDEAGKDVSDHGKKTDEHPGLHRKPQKKSDPGSRHHGADEPAHRIRPPDQAPPVDEPQARIQRPAPAPAQKVIKQNGGTIRRDDQEKQLELFQQTNGTSSRASGRKPGPIYNADARSITMNSLPTTALLVLLFLVSPAPSADPAQPPSQAGEPDTWNRAEETATEWLQQSREAAEGAWDGTRDSAGKLWDDTRNAAGDAWISTRELLGPQPADRFGQTWDQVLPKLEETLILQDRHADLPESAWFGEDRESNQEAIDALLDEAVAILSSSDVRHYRERIRILYTEIGEARQAIADDRRRRVSAPEKSLVKRTVEDFDQAIEQREANIERYQDELVRVRRAFAADLRKIGLDLADEQVELLLSTVVGDNLIDLGIVFDSVKAITAQLEQLVRESGEDLQSARRYYGMYLILLKSLNQMHLQIEEAIAERYLPQIDAIVTRAKALTAETRALQEQSPDKAVLLAANLSAQHLTIQTAGIYREYLVDQGRQVAEARLELERDIAAAWNTYETVRVSGELVGLVRSSRKLLDGLFDRQVPALRPFRNLEMKREFEKLTAQLRKGERS